MNKILIAIIALAALSTASPYANPITDTQIKEILLMARQADINNFFTYSGVILTDNPDNFNPRIACLTAYAFNTVYRNAYIPPERSDIIVSKAVCNPYSHYMGAAKGITAIKKGQIDAGNRLIGDNIAGG